MMRLGPVILILTYCSLLSFISCLADIQLPAIVTYTMTEDSEVPFTLGDVLANILQDASLNVNIKDVLIFPSSQPFSEYFQLVNRWHSNQALVSSELQLVKPFDLENACKKRLSFHQCLQSNIACCCDPRELFCSVKLQLAFKTDGSDFFASVQQPQRPFKAFLVEIKVIDRNDHAPVFSPNKFTLRVSEGMKSGESYRLPVARDNDLGQNAEVGYAISSVFEHSPCSNEWHKASYSDELFSVDTDSKDLSLVINGDIDREKIDMYKILVVANDHAAKPDFQKTGTLTVSLNVKDTNDMRPEFQNPNLDVEVLENASNGTVIGTVFALDPDTGVNGQVRYSIHSKHRDTPFKIDSESGLLTVSGQIDREAIDHYSIIVEAFDGGTPPKTAALPVLIRVLDTNDNAPIIFVSSSLAESSSNDSRVSISNESVTLLVSEATPIGSCIANISVNDPDTVEGDNVFCRADEEKFDLHRTTSGLSYSLQVAQILDYETENNFQVKIICADANTPHALKSEMIVKVKVLNENDNLPVLQDPLVFPPAWRINSTCIGQFAAILGTKDKQLLLEMANDFIIFVPKIFPLGEAFVRFLAVDADVSFGDATEKNDMHFAPSIYDEQHFQPENGLYSNLIPGRSSLFSFSASTGEVFLTSTPNMNGIISVFKGEITVKDSRINPLMAAKNFTFILSESNLNTPILRIFNFALSNSLSPYQIFDQEQNTSIQEVPFYIPRESVLDSVIGQVVGSDADSGQAGHVVYDLTFNQSGCINVDINNSTGLLILSELKDDLIGKCRSMATLTVSDGGFPRRYKSLKIIFQLFDFNRMSPRILVNESIIPVHETANWTSLWNFASIIPFTRKSLFQMKVHELPGVIEAFFKVKFCVTEFAASEFIEIDERKGTVYFTKPPTLPLKRSFYITVANRLWPSLAPWIYKVELKADKNAPLAVQILSVERLDCKLYDTAKSEFRGQWGAIKVFCISTFAIAISLCLAIAILVVLIRKPDRKAIFPALRRAFKGNNEKTNVYDEIHFQGTAVQLVEPLEEGEQLAPCLKGRAPPFKISSQSLTSPQLPVHSHQLEVKSNEIQASLAPVYQAPPDVSGSRGSGVEGALILMENMPQQPPRQAPVSVKFHCRKDVFDTGMMDDSSRGSPASLRVGKKEKGQANFNIIVHNDFKKSLPSKTSVTFSTDEKTAKIYRIGPSVQAIYPRRSSVGMYNDSISLKFLKGKPCNIRPG